MSRFHVGLDLGQASDYTAIAVVQEAGDDLHVRHLERFRHTLYPDVANRVEALLDSPQLKGKAELVIDTTGVGPAVSDLFIKRSRFFKPVRIHGGDAETCEEGIYRVPKRNVVTALQVALQTGTLKISSALELAELLREELLNFRIKINIATGHDQYEHWRSGDHDDLVLAAALAVWSARTPQPTIAFV
jgi:hypothetical protein